MFVEKQQPIEYKIKKKYRILAGENWRQISCSEEVKTPKENYKEKKNENKIMKDHQCFKYE